MGRVGDFFVRATLLAIAFGGTAAAAVAGRNGPDLARGKNGSIDRRATPVGYEANGEGLYACVGDFNSGRHPGKIRPCFDGCNIGYGGKEYAAKTYSVLISGGNWVPMNQ
ncbi:MAG: DUF3421 domain-containing protein, partial [Novosphingobium sp.]|nr:DUF3421 domain-containing protein [Novosphingobium sp.]